jgi:CheY-like chemotaxis protein
MPGRGYSRAVIRILYQGPPHPVLGLVSMLEDEDYEVTFDRPDLSSQEPVAVDLSVADLQMKGVDGAKEVVQEFKDRHADLPVVIGVEDRD